jgi:hypothetical protein
MLHVRAAYQAAVFKARSRMLNDEERQETALVNGASRKNGDGVTG